ncbi:hypothetical protein [Thermosipho atlanticus]|uniref:Uncharacterized protein n=1 Tax=Thermosipho atlanticus DSM 15807 TaxID=1123380 RepID=A0A1M5RYY4_9BACT|nr:hypothetical protein [Thermosipho atlanticus]SHH31552.1 hypothetical protein SAMN02745199_0711 [Thermosipho atlanticus DSM 15807]
MSFLLLTIATSIVLYVFTKSFWFLLLIIIGVYYLLKENIKMQNFLSLTFILMMALVILSRLRGYEPKGLNFLFYASFASILYDLLKKVYWSIPFFGLLGLGISYIGTIKYGNIGYFFGLMIIPIFLREFRKRGSNIENSNTGGGIRKKNEI